MKKYISMALALVLGLSLFGCGEKKQTAPETPPSPYAASKADIAHLDSLYAGRSVLHGQLHEHGKTGRKSDGKTTLADWKAGLAELNLDFVALLDHKQTDHMYDKEWDPTMFICGTEPGTNITDRNPLSKKTHYNILIPDVKDLENILNAFPEYGLSDGLFSYPDFTSDRFIELIQAVQSAGGLFVIPHPLQVTDTKSSVPLDYYYCDFVGLEVFYHPNDTNSDINDKCAVQNYELWTKILARGKRVYATAGADSHNLPTIRALTTVYAEQKLNTSMMTHLAAGDFTAGPVGIRMAIGDTLMGGTGSFKDAHLVFSVGDIFEGYMDPTHTYRVVVHSDKGVVFRETISPNKTTYFSVDVDENAKFYRIEVYDTALNHTLLALGQPIWNEAFYN